MRFPVLQYIYVVSSTVAEHVRFKALKDRLDEDTIMQIVAAEKEESFVPAGTSQNVLRKHGLAGTFRGYPMLPRIWRMRDEKVIEYLGNIDSQIRSQAEVVNEQIMKRKVKLPKPNMKMSKLIWSGFGAIVVLGTGVWWRCGSSVVVDRVGSRCVRKGRESLLWRLPWSNCRYI